MVNDFLTKKIEDPQSTSDHRSTNRSDPTNKSMIQKKRGKWKVKNHEKTLGNVTVPYQKYGKWKVESRRMRIVKRLREMSQFCYLKSRIPTV